MPPLPLYILAGGRSRRFGSDKARVEFGGQPLIGHVAARLASVVEPVTVVAEQAGKYADLGMPTIADEAPGLGPMGGLVTALRHRRGARGEGWLVLAACDLVDADAGLVERLQARVTDTSRAVAFRGERWEPMLALYHTALLSAAERCVAQGERAMWRLLEREGASAVELPATHATLRQINTPEDHRRAEQEAANQTRKTREGM